MKKIIIEDRPPGCGSAIFTITDDDNCDGVVEFLIKVLGVNVWKTQADADKKILVLRDLNFQDELTTLIKKYEKKKTDKCYIKDKLMWQVDIDDLLLSFKDAETYCEELNYASYKDWRVPTILELATLIDYTKTSPACVIGNSTYDFYWSSTKFVGAENDNFVVFFGTGDIDRRNAKGSHYVRAVRDI